MKNSSNSATLKSILRRIAPYKFRVILSLLLTAVNVALTLYAPVLVGQAIDAAALPQADMATAVSALIKLGITTLLAAVLQWCVNSLNNTVTFRVVRDVRGEAFDRLTKMPLSYLDRKPTGELVSRLVADAEAFADGLLMGFTRLFSGVATIIGTLVFMLTLSPLISLAVVVVTPLSLFVARFIANRTHKMFSEQAKTRAEQTAFIDEMIGSHFTVKAFSMEEQNSGKFKEINSRLEKTSLKAIFFSSLTNPCTRFVNSVVYALVALFGGLMCISSANTAAFTVGSLAAFLSYANQYTKPFNEISGVIAELQNAFACAARIFEITDEKEEAPDSENAETLENVKGDVKLENVSFSYLPERPLIKKLNLSVKAGQRIAIVGPTGCGKTTLINLFMRFYDVTGGEIRVDGKEIRDVTRLSLRENYGMVLQETWLKNGTVRENIALGKPDAAEEEIVAAARKAHADSFIRRLPEGYDTVISDEGSGLSQGQKQLLCISRIMLTLPPMLILDEATSSIDTRTEIKIQQAFSHLMQGRTSFIVAHRLSTIREADLILVMKDGDIVEQGNHAELMKLNGFYAKLYNSRYSADEE